VNDRLLTARAVAERLDVTPETVLRWTRRGELPAIRLPGTARGRLRYRPEEVEAWLEEHATTGTADRGLSHTRANRARRDGHYDPLPFSASHTPPVRPATTEEDT
jgi:excisionase family DNA binding protein